MAPNGRTGRNGTARAGMSSRRARVFAGLLMAALLLPGAAGGAEPDPEVLLQQYRCTICHARAETLAGPSWVEVAGRYRGNPRAVAILAAVVKKGEHGDALWPMPPLPQVPDADARRMIAHILAQTE
jgi:cytochrome c551/c552